MRRGFETVCFRPACARIRGSVHISLYFPKPAPERPEENSTFHSRGPCGHRAGGPPHPWMAARRGGQTLQVSWVSLFLSPEKVLCLWLNDMFSKV